MSTQTSLQNQQTTARENFTCADSAVMQTPENSLNTDVDHESTPENGNANEKIDKNSNPKNEQNDVDKLYDLREDNILGLVSALDANNFYIIMKATKMLRTILSKEGAAIIEEIVFAKIVPKLVGQLEKIENTDLQFEVCLVYQHINI
jgi:hypothetical protein